jgi:hypothetical protein
VACDRMGQRTAPGILWHTSPTVMLGGTVNAQFTTVEDVAEVAVFFAALPSNALTGQSLAVSHGWGMHSTIGGAAPEFSYTDR